jgi:hypothetical protein
VQIPQTTYSDFPAQAVAGQIADLSPTHTISRLAEGPIGAGCFVAKGTSRDQTLLPAAGTDVSAHLDGVAIYTALKEPYTSTAQYKATDSVPVLRKGPIWVQVAVVAVTDDSVPYIYHTGSNAGKIRGTTDGSATVAPSGVKVIQGAAPGGLALVELNLV